jgi:hypothetical protein
MSPSSPKVQSAKRREAGRGGRVSAAGLAQWARPCAPAPRRVTPGEPRRALARGGVGVGPIRYPCGPPPNPACDWLGGRVCPPRRAGRVPCRGVGGGGSEAEAGRGERGPGLRSEGVDEPGPRDRRAGSERGGERPAGEREATRGSPAGSAPPPRAGTGAGAAAASRRALGSCQPSRPAAFREEAVPAAAGAHTPAPSPAGPGRFPCGGVRAGPGAGRAGRGAEGRPAARAAAQPSRSASDPARGAGSMATGLGEQVYGLSEDEVSGVPFPPRTPRGVPAGAGWGGGRTTAEVRVPCVFRGALNSGALEIGVLGGGWLGPSSPTLSRAHCL